jgi:hypothetical protein
VLKRDPPQDVATTYVSLNVERLPEFCSRLTPDVLRAI